MRAVAYLRVSSPSQIEGYSLDAQNASSWSSVRTAAGNPCASTASPPQPEAMPSAPPAGASIPWYVLRRSAAR